MDTQALQQQLRDGLHAEQFEPWFEPLVRLEDGGIIGYEALLRWRHPARGVLLPADFLAAAEESGQIEAIDWRMFRLACEAAAGLPRDQFVSINVAPRMLRHDDDFDARLLELVQAAGIEPAQLRIELGADRLLRESAEVAAMLLRLKEAGVESVIDRFGTGFSSLALVQRLPLRMMKLDRTFIGEHIEDGNGRGHALLTAMLALARSVGMESLAEGIETEEQRRMLQRMGCRYGQGFLFGRAQPLAHWLGRG